MDYSYVIGHNGRSKLLYSHGEKNLYSLKSGMKMQYECYHNTSKQNITRCPVYCKVEGNTVRRNNEQHFHPDHHVKYNDLVSLNAMRSTCKLLKEHCPSAAHRIPLYDIFLHEISKQVFLNIFSQTVFYVYDCI